MQGLIRNTAVFYLLLLVLVKVLAVPAICLHYQLNKAFIAANLCENKNRPAMNCNGKCQLRKQLAKTTNTSDSQTQKAASSFSMVEFCEHVNTYSFEPNTVSNTVFNTCTITHTNAGYYGDVFHPPLA